MNKFNKLSLAISVLSATLSVNALAEQSIATNGIYIGAGLTPVVGITSGSYKTDPGATLALGYRINNNFAVETSYTGFFEEFASGQIIDLSVKGIMPITPNFSVYGKLGGAAFHAKEDVDFLWINEHSSVTRYAPEAGAGLSYNFTRNFTTDLGMSVIPVGSGLTLMPVTFGLRYTFG